MEYWALIIAAIGTIATAFASVLNWRLLRETALMRQAQTEPAISLHLERGSHISFLNLVIQNYGQGPAFDLRSEVAPSPKELEKHGVVPNSLTLLNEFEHLAPKQRVNTFFGSAIELLASNCPPITVAVRYKNGQGADRVERYTLNPCQFSGITECGDSPEGSMAKSLEKIAKEFGRVTSGGRVRVIGTVDEKPWLRNVPAARKERDIQVTADELAPQDPAFNEPHDLDVTPTLTSEEHAA
jgi:hypothetical protein